MADSRQAGSLWTPEEDVALLKHVSKYGTKHWGYLQTSGVLPHRDQKACCNRFILLKRKFFQARAKGQRLTFPVVPHPADPKTPSSGLPGSTVKTSSSGLPASPSCLRPSPTTSFKQTSSATPSSAAVNIKRALSSQLATGIGAAGNEKPSTCSYQVEKPSTLRRTVENLAQSLLQNPQVVPQHMSSPAGSLAVREAVVPSSVDVRSKGGPSSTAVVAPKVEASLDTVVCLDEGSSLPSLEDTQVGNHSVRSFTVTPASASPLSENAGQSERQQPLTLETLDSMTDGLPAANSIQSAILRCFNPALVEAVQQEMDAMDNMGLAFIDQELGSCQGVMAPDALLDQIASAPARMLFGGQNGGDLAPCPPESSATPQGGGLWQSSSAAVTDLWDLLRSTAAM